MLVVAGVSLDDDPVVAVVSSLVRDGVVVKSGTGAGIILVDDAVVMA